MRYVAGRSMLFLGWLHTIVAVMLYWDDLRRYAGGWFFNVSPQVAVWPLASGMLDWRAEASVWFFATGAALLLVGDLLVTLEAVLGYVPKRAAGCLLLFFAAFSWVSPMTGLPLGLVLSGWIYKKARHSWSLLPATHRARRFRVHALASDFTLLDTWAVPLVGEAGALPDFLRFMGTVDPAGSRLASWLFRLRFRLGEIFGWDAGCPLPIPDCREKSVAERLSEDDRQRHLPCALPPSALGGASPTLVYRFENEALLEITNRTVHALLHLGWVDAGGGKRRPELAIYVKLRGTSSRLYMALIAPFRHLVIYPAWMKALSREWPQFIAGTTAEAASVARPRVSPIQT